jgi:hypothetical protein
MQVVMNIRRKSSVGWSIQNVLLDFTGGTMSVAQLLLQCVVTNDFTQIAGNPVKFGLGFVSISFDIVFMVQHYCIYLEPRQLDSAATEQGSEVVSTGQSECQALLEGAEQVSRHVEKQ